MYSMIGAEKSVTEKIRVRKMVEAGVDSTVMI